MSDWQKNSFCRHTYAMDLIWTGSTCNCDMLDMYFFSMWYDLSIVQCDNTQNTFLYKEWKLIEDKTMSHFEVRVDKLSFDSNFWCNIVRRYKLKTT